MHCDAAPTTGLGNRVTEPALYSHSVLYDTSDISKMQESAARCVSYPGLPLQSEEFLCRRLELIRCKHDLPLIQDNGMRTVLDKIVQPQAALDNRRLAGLPAEVRP